MELTLEIQTLAAANLGSSFCQEDTGACKHQFAILPLVNKHWALPPSPPACWYQYWDNSGQAASWVGTWLHPPAGWLPLEPLSSQKPKDPALSTRGPRTWLCPLLHQPAPAPRLPGPCSHLLGPEPTHQQANTNSRTPRARDPKNQLCPPVG